MPAGTVPDESPDAAAVLADVRLRGAVADLFLAAEARLDERTRLAVEHRLAALVNGIEGALRQQAIRLLAARGHAAADATLGEPGSAFARLTEAGTFRDAPLIADVIALARTELIGEALPLVLDQAGRPSFLVRLADAPDGLVAAAARALLAAESRPDRIESDLPAELYERAVWWVAAAMRPPGRADGDRDIALAEAARRCIGAHDGSDRVDAAAMRLATGLDLLPEELPTALVEAIGDRRLALFIALLSRAAEVDPDVARALVLDPHDDRLWYVLHGLGLRREEIARIGLSLADADPRRDIEAFADGLDALFATPVDTMATAVKTLKLPRAFRAAIVALARP